ncbi:MAG TPA: hypothetical protein VKQ36_12190 [Ktedonobacterales bacterium]|nr:hypothetical protein [Ktedonobacterales bacterium]
MIEQEPRQPEPDHALAAALAAINRPWRLAPELPLSALDALPAAIPGVTRLQAQLLHNRGVSGIEAAKTFLRGEWRSQGNTLPNLGAAVARLRWAIAQDNTLSSLAITIATA